MAVSGFPLHAADHAGLRVGRQHHRIGGRTVGGDGSEFELEPPDLIDLAKNLRLSDLSTEAIVNRLQQVVASARLIRAAVEGRNR